MTLDIGASLFFGILAACSLFLAWRYRRYTQSALTGWQQSLAMNEELLRMVQRYEAMFGALMDEAAVKTAQEEEGNDPPGTRDSSYLN